MFGCQNSEDDTLPCTNSTGCPVRPVTESTAVVSRLAGTRSAVMPGNHVCIVPPRCVATASLAESRTRRHMRSHGHGARHMRAMVKGYRGNLFHHGCF